LHATSLQLPDAQEEDALARSHASPQAPQLTALVSGDSQPLAGLPSQSPKPAAQLAVPHAPLTQLGVPAAVEQELPHAPQALTLFSEVSQPLLGRPSQSA
jgi:hypothetical protein